MRIRNVVAPWLSSGRQTLLSILLAVIVVFSVIALLKINSSANQPPARELLTGSIPRSPAVRKPPGNDSMAAFLALDANRVPRFLRNDQHGPESPASPSGNPAAAMSTIRNIVQKIKARYADAASFGPIAVTIARSAGSGAHFQSLSDGPGNEGPLGGY